MPAELALGQRYSEDGRPGWLEGKMPVSYLPDPELARLSGWPGWFASDEDAITFFTLTSDDLG